ncbi:DUF2897 family protein [Idiomarina aminovorans]|uniref:DUF2897 family protein n=1 Tax=Idiomarina aminovorans TaxID=2914829 RepID=UPI002006756E|nr:DUF2897 family protein [Idiomarina sp. ATCH4]MCK7458385.1 DUF2897 family protein [Idiomarina sp. ATCH4]
MNEYLVWLLIALVLGVVISNVMVLKYTAKLKWPDAESPKTKDDSDQNTETKD